MPAIRPASAGFLSSGQLLLWVDSRLAGQIDSDVSCRPIGDIALIVDCEKGDLDCGEEPSKNNELRKTKT